MPIETPQWLQWARRLQAVAQNGLTYAEDPFDVERYMEIQRIAAEMLAGGAPGRDVPAWLADFHREKGYATPKVDVRAAVIRDGRVLLVREREDGGWTLPGGWADVGDAPSLAALREVREESGYEAKIRKLAAVYDRDRNGHPPSPFHSYKLFFVCDLTGGEAKVSHETIGVDFFEENAIPPLSLPRVTPTQIAHMFEHYRHPEWPTTFD
jgi:ADP-ribose pyrophosphatase YjhB (NUDIX family)